MQIFTSPSAFLNSEFETNNIKFDSTHILPMKSFTYFVGITHCGIILVAQMVKNLPATQETQVQSLGQEESLPVGRREWLPTPVFLPGEFHGQRSLVGYGRT